MDKVSESQIDELLDYLSTHRPMVHGVGLGTRSQEQHKKMWDDLAQRLNTHGTGATKSGYRWKRYWISLKHKVKSRTATRKQELQITDEWPSKQAFMNKIDKKVMSIIGGSPVYRGSKHRVEVFINEPPTVENIPLKRNPSSTCASPEQSYEDTQEPNISDPDVERGSKIVEEAKKTPTKEFSWLLDLEHRRVAAEEKMAEAAHLMAQAAIMNAEAARTIAQATLNHGEIFSNIIDIMKNKI